MVPSHKLNTILVHVNARLHGISGKNMNSIIIGRCNISRCTFDDKSDRNKGKQLMRCHYERSTEDNLEWTLFILYTKRIFPFIDYDNRGYQRIISNGRNHESCTSFKCELYIWRKKQIMQWELEMYLITILTVYETFEFRNRIVSIWYFFLYWYLIIIHFHLDYSLTE